ncbi:YihY/virulence factor BrkB family protein [Pedobacter sp. BS3]|uniref:YihY/virulence factor BrkB family protein n=1 Tax=Pedobacter sp. BS3 TaxID=2567937 RepID=UPI0011ECEAD6|nr:YihY/virulence factor BrkB family protein [Pedobacter sp. BS3]TZF83688.1 YihY/virulence factor BrkB family protein [Pedobacter sp. BS3]
MGWIHKTLLKFKPYHYLIEWTKVIIFPGFSPLPLYTVGVFFFQEIKKESLTNKASSLAYNFMLAIFPGLLFLFTLIPYIPIANFQDQLISLIALVLPHNAYMAVESTLQDIVKKQNGGLLSFGFFAALYFATNGVHKLMQAFNKASLTLETRGWFKQRVIALNLTLLMVSALIVGLVIITIGEYILNFLKSELELKDSFWIYVLMLSRWIIMIAIYFTTISILYRYGPANPKRWRLFSAGAWLATFLAILTSLGFAFYINNFGNYNKLYGSIGTLIVIMIWLYLNSLIILVGFELNASIDLSKKSIKIVKPVFNSFKRQPADNQ